MAKNPKEEITEKDLKKIENKGTQATAARFLEEGETVASDGEGTWVEVDGEWVLI